MYQNLLSHEHGNIGGTKKETMNCGEREECCLGSYFLDFFPKATLTSYLGQKPHQFRAIPWPEAHSEGWNHWERGPYYLIPCSLLSALLEVLFLGSRTNLRRIRYRTLSLPVYLPSQSPREFLFFTSLYF